MGDSEKINKATYREALAWWNGLTPEQREKLVEKMDLYLNSIGKLTTANTPRRWGKSSIIKYPKGKGDE